MIWLWLLAVACGPKPAPPVPPLPHAAYAHYLDGKLAGYRDDWPAAADALADAAAAAPDQPMLAVELARAQAKAKRTAAAKTTLAAARVKWPGHASVWVASGDLLAATAPKEAIGAYRRAIELAPLEERSYLGLAKLEEPPAALATLRKLVERVPASVDGHYRLGQRLAINKDVGGAIAALRKVLELDPDHIDARLDLARGLRLQGKLDEAIAQTRSAFDRSGQALDLAEELFYLLLEADDRVAAIDLLTLLDDDRSDADSLAVVARLDRTLGRVEEAKAIAARIAKLDAELGALVQADLALATGDPAQAALGALAVPRSSERFGLSRRVAAIALLAMAEPQRALDALAPARTAAPKDVDLATLAAFALVDLGRKTEAIEVLAKLPEDTAVLFARARVADRAGDPKAAVAHLETILRDKPDHGGALNLAGYLLADANLRLDDAERYLRRARELQPGDPAILDSWGWLLYRKRDYAGAIKVLDKAARYAPLEAEILVHLASAHLAASAPAVASGLLDRAAALHPPPAVTQRIAALRKQLPPRR
jgi:tetratricopeptide (TPR) repeat protein